MTNREAAPPPAPYRSLSVWAVSAGGWLILGALNSGSELIDLLTGNSSARAWEPIVWEYSSALAFAVLTPFVISFALRVRFRSHSRLVALASHGLAALAFSWLHVALMVGTRKLVYTAVGRSYEFGRLGLELLYEGFKDVVSYSLLIGLVYGFDYYRRYRERELATSRLEASLSKAQLRSLEQQIQPHFLFNTLNMISATMHDDVKQADHMITRLSDLLRMLVRHGEQQEVPLAEEVNILHAYLDIMKGRFENRLQVHVTVDDADLVAQVPRLLLQPLVENAIKHGLADREEPGRIEVCVERQSSQLHIRVSDDGPGLSGPPADILSAGVGLSNTVERLEHLYGSEQQLTFHDAAGGGFEVRIRIPLRVAAADLVGSRT